MIKYWIIHKYIFKFLKYIKTLKLLITKQKLNMVDRFIYIFYIYFMYS